VKSRGRNAFSSTETTKNSTQKHVFLNDRSHWLQALFAPLFGLSLSSFAPQQEPGIVRIVLDLGENLSQQCFTWWIIAQNLSNVRKIQSLPNFDNCSFTSIGTLQECTFPHASTVAVVHICSVPRLRTPPLSRTIAHLTAAFFAMPWTCALSELY
jgi:hypothetical protein